VIGFDSGVKSDIPVTTCATNNLAAAALAADKMAELIGKSGEVAVIAADQTGKSNIDRRDGFVNAMKKYPGIKVVSIQYGGDILQASEATKSIILANPGLKGIFGANEGCANGVANGIKELGKAGKLVAVGFDSGKAQIDNVKSGLLAGSITQNPVGMGYKTVEAAVKALKGEKLPKVIDTGFFWYDAKNYTKPEIAAVLYQ
jgi:ribose transport system substrate-binding protein